MPIPNWPEGVPDKPRRGDWRMQQRYIPPIATDMAGNNTRQRPRPGPDVATIQQTLRFTPEQHDAFFGFVLNTLNKGTSRFIGWVWMGSAMQRHVLQFVDPHPVPSSERSLKIPVSMTLRVYRKIETLEIAGTPVTAATEDEPYEEFQVVASGGVPGYTYSIQSGALPVGITLNSATGVVSGTPTEAGTFAGVVIRVTDNQSETADLDPFTIEVAAA